MHTIYKSTENGLTEVTELTPGCWVNMIDPTTDEIERVTTLGIPADFITYPLDMDERARIEREDDGKMLIILRIPYYEGPRVDIPYTTIPLGIVLTERLIITICRRPNEVIQEFTSGKMRGLSTAKRNRFILRLLLMTANRFLAYLREINRLVEATEDKMQASMQNREVLELLKYSKSLVLFTQALKSNELMLERLKRSQLFHQYPEDEDLLEDVITENQQAIEMVNISSTILSSLMDAFASIISNNLNVVMKFLASVTIVLSIPTIVTSFFGMNVKLPFQNLDLAYLLIIVLFLTISAVIVYLFIKRDWF
ncbi:MAG TPA: magnesium transporter CorA family protein [Anaerolineaceae bacterium]|jgi:magnesium transporter|nr:magnesium transporter CorA family protein [Longilinea sp.]HNS64787.1 magnesium transporter CorA family protein [Anaerolineaceae bacterium]HNZ00733.1 magnesium transporter CorA family protein [Anaerolineaceae bacterium]HOH19343.1 magnesium transporter CorA family protein [Anaerolineaceae bacterium]HOU43883.1 magnesium transporter CorA family protein [Anaerolineaceae bacterium]